MARTQMIPADHGQLEVMLDTPETDLRHVAVFCHPHPLHGGTMHNKVVYHSAKSLVELGGAVARFNFRGVGKSTGSHDEGVGEIDDVHTVLQWVQGQYPQRPTILGGFSFGSMVALNLVKQETIIDFAIGVGIPVSLYDFSFLNQTTLPTLLIQGSNDEFGPYREISNLFSDNNACLTLKKIEEADHFLTDHYDELNQIITNFFRNRFEEASR